jgi:hypothetical protein
MSAAFFKAQRRSTKKRRVLNIEPVSAASPLGRRIFRMGSRTAAYRLLACPLPRAPKRSGQGVGISFNASWPELPGVVMKRNAMFCVLGAFAMFSSSAFAQGNQPSSSQSLNAGDNVQTAPAHKATHDRKMKSGKSSAGAAAPATQPGGTPTPSGPNAPVSASGSGQ